MDKTLFAQYFPLLFIAIWIGALYLLSLIGGWSALAEKYRCDSDITDNWRGWQSGYFGILHYGGCLWIATTPRGLCLKTGPFFIFSAFHPPLCIPWENIASVKEGTFFFVRLTDFQTTNPNVKVSIAGSAIRDGERFYANKITAG